MRSRLSICSNRLELSHRAPFDSLFELSPLDDVRDINAGRHDVVWIELTGIDYLLDLGNRYPRRGRHHGIEVPRGLPVNQIPFAVPLVRLDEREVRVQRRFEHVI